MDGIPIPDGWDSHSGWMGSLFRIDGIPVQDGWGPNFKMDGIPIQDRWETCSGTHHCKTTSSQEERNICVSVYVCV